MLPSIPIFCRIAGEFARERFRDIQINCDNLGLPIEIESAFLDDINGFIYFLTFAWDEPSKLDVDWVSLCECDGHSAMKKVVGHYDCRTTVWTDATTGVSIRGGGNLTLRFTREALAARVEMSLEVIG